MAIVAVGNVTETVLTGLTPDTEYTVRIRALDGAGNTSAWSSTVPLETAANLETFTFGAVTTGQVTGLTAETDYTARIRARDSAGNWSAWSSTVPFTTAAAAAAPPTVVAGPARPVVRSGSVLLDVTATPPGGQTIASHSWAITGGGAGSLTNATTATPTYNAPPTGSGLVTIRDTVTASGGGVAVADVVVSYHVNVVAAENALTGTAREDWDLASPNLGGIETLQGFCDGFTVDKAGTANFKIGQSDGAGWTAEVFRLGWYNSDGARSYGTLTPSGPQLTASQAQPTPGDADASTTRLSADAGNWSTTLTWSPPAWAPSGMYVLRLNRTGGGASHVMFIVRDDARRADLMFMPADSTWNAYNAWGGLGANQYTGNSLYYGVNVDQYNGDCAKFVSYNRPFVNRGAADTGRSYGAVEWSNFFTSEYGMLRFIERNGIDVKYYGCIDAGGDASGIQLIGNGTTRGGAAAGIFVGHNEYWSNNMRAGWEAARDAGVSVFSCAGNEVFWRTVGTLPDSEGRPRLIECQKSTIGGRGNTRPEWTGTWRDPDGAGKGGDDPENSFTGTSFMVNGPTLRSLVVPFAGGYSAMPLWRHTSVAALTSGQSFTSGNQILGFEWDTYSPSGVDGAGAAFIAAPHADVRYCSNVTYAISGDLLVDAGDVYGSGNATHRLVVYPATPEGGLVFGTGTVNWPFGCDDTNTYQAGNNNVSTVIQQATLNILTDMGAPPLTIMSGMTQPTPVSWFDAAPEVGDTGSAVDTLTVGARTLPLADTGSAADTLAVGARTLALADTGSAADALTVGARTLPLADTGSAADTLTVGARTLPLADTGSAVETRTVAATVALTEQATGVDSIINGVDTAKPLSDAGAGGDSLTVAGIAVAVADTAGGVDQFAVAVTAAAGDVAAAADALTALAAAAIADTAAAVDGFTVVKMAGPVDTGSAVDSMSVLVALSVADFAAAVDTLIDGDPSDQVIVAYPHWVTMTVSPGGITSVG